MSTHKKKPVRLRSAKPKNRLWGILFILTLLLLGIWFFSSIIFSFALHWTAGVKESQVIALVSSSDQSAPIVIALLDPDDIYSKIILVNPQKNIGTLIEPWEVASTAGVLVNRVIQLNEADFSSDKAVVKTVKSNIVNSLKAGQWQVALQLLPIGKILSQKGVVEVNESFTAATELSVLGRLGDSCPIGIANTTSIAGVASKYADLITNQGGLVVRVTNQDMQIQDTEIILDDQLVAKCTAVAQLIEDALPELAKIEIKSGIYTHHRVGVLVLLGQNAVDKIQQLPLVDSK